MRVCQVVERESGTGITATAFNIEILQQQLDTAFFGRGERLQYVPILGSTNTVAMKLAQEGHVGEGFVLLTDSQTAGRGRLGRQWVDAFGCSILSSTVLMPRFQLSLLVMLASLAIVDTIDAVCNVNATIKWPNDVLIEGRKVAGILIETTHNHAGQRIAIIGIGVNAHNYPIQTEVEQNLVKKAITLEEACGHRVSRETFVAQLLKHIEAFYISLQEDTTSSVISSTDKDVNPSWGPASRLIRERWRSRLSTLGRTIEVRQGDTVLSGIAEDVDDSGELFLRLHSGERVCITWGDVGYPAE
ncbi:MAG: hypothetical protein NVS4B1_13830 [Ktedonobacteraceae bacterium]